MNTILSTIFSALALVVSIGLLIVHYRNQLERRHGEIVQLKERTESALRLLRQRFVSVLTQGEVIRMELRRLPDGKVKYDAIESFPRILENATRTKTSVDEILAEIEKMETHQLNRSELLLTLQSIASKSDKVAAAAQVTENAMLSLATTIRERLVPS